jgi:hypothetical protein
MRSAKSYRLASVIAALLALGALASSCAGDSSGSASPAKRGATVTTSARQGNAQITTLDAPASIACNGKTSTTVRIAYATTGAASKQLLVDGLHIDGTDPADGQLDVPVHCDQLPHTVVMVAKDADGGKTVKQTMVTTDLGAG